MDAVAGLNENLKGYELRERIGAGGFGAVYRAYQTTVGREVAIKIILPGLANQPDFIRRFEGEAQLVARLEHPHITPLYDYWRDPEGAYLVMRWLRGGSLRDALQNGPFELRAAALLLDQVAGALSLAHRRNVIHRDIKPGNILIDEDGNAYLTDFGIAKDLNLQDNKTAPDAIVGSLDYLSPEQARGEPITARTDIYSLGVTLFEMITGHHPFENVSSIERLYKHINDPLPEITTLDESVLDAVNRVIQKSTAKNPDARYPDALAFAADFREAAGLNRTPTAVVELLTQREQEILNLIIAGLSNKEIAQRLTVAISTVKWYVKQIYDKLGVRSRVQAQVRARELNLLVQPIEPSAMRVPTEDFHPENPYKGLRAFESADYQDFFGREKVTAKLVGRLGESGDYARFLAVVGPSGSGKSSLVKAGLIPALWRGDLPASEKWFIVEMLPGAHPLDELEIALTKVAANQATMLHEHLERDARGLLRAAQLILPNDGSQLVLVIDQFEELFTMVADEQARTHFLGLLYAAVTEARSKVRVIITLRADFYDRPLHYPQFGELVRSRLETLLPLTAEELERAIAEPAKRAGAVFEPGLVASIVADVNYQPGALPLLQFALAELFEQRQGRLLTREAYEAIGKTVGALAKRAEEVFLGLDEAGQEAARQMFLRLVTLGEGTEDTRRRAARSELLAIAADGELMDEVIDTFAAYRLLALDNEPGTRTPTVEVAHEALLREWERLRLWLDKSRDDIKMGRQLGALAAEWRGSEKNASYLARGSRLEHFAKWAGETALALTPDERAYLNASIAQSEAETKAEAERQAREKGLERRAVLFLRGMVGVLLLATVGALVLAGTAIYNANEAQSERDNARRSAAESQNVALVAGSQAAYVRGNLDEAIALSLQAVILDPTSTRAQAALSDAAYAPGTVRYFEGDGSQIWGVVLSPDGSRAISIGIETTPLVWDMESGQILYRLGAEGEAHSHPVLDASFSPDGRTALTVSDDATVILWDVETGRFIRSFVGHSLNVRSVMFSPDGRTALTASDDTTVILWEVESGEPIRVLHGHSAPVQAATYSPDGHTALSGGNDNIVIQWDLETGEILRRFERDTPTRISLSPDGRTVLCSCEGSFITWDLAEGDIIRHFAGGHAAMVNTPEFSPDGRNIISGSPDGTLFVWNVETGTVTTRLHVPGYSGGSVGMTGDGRYLVSGSFDGSLRVWDLQPGQIERRFEANTPYNIWIFSGVAISPDDRTAISSADGGAAILWDMQSGRELRRLEGYTYDWNPEFSPDGQTILVPKGDVFSMNPGYVGLLDIRTGAEIGRLEGHHAGVDAVAFSPDGRLAASGAGDELAILWDVETGQEIRRFNTHHGVVDDVAFSPDGRWLISGDYDGYIMRWDVETGESLQFNGRHWGIVSSVAISPDGRTVYSSAWEGAVIAWDIETGEIIRRLNGHTAATFTIAVSPEGSQVFAGSADGTGILWDAETGNIMRRFAGGPYGAAFTADGHSLLVSNNGQVELWRLDSAEQLMAWTRANRYVPELTCEQRDLYRLEPLCEASDV